MRGEFGLLAFASNGDLAAYLNAFASEGGLQPVAGKELRILYATRPAEGRCGGLNRAGDQRSEASARFSQGQLHVLGALQLRVSAHRSADLDETLRLEPDTRCLPCLGGADVQRGDVAVQ